ncbi:PleD family two-component system response regulator [Geobacter sp. AOG1]|uniref:response regulator n=1 Tax=Geobacter sp. AOG1 TaxID=1566346 RepID=UPI001DA086CF|nr:response regulator [Geobacter sp. AOG1]GFE58264.1 response regulator [Geobacter sp. AOG1]
MGNKLLLADDSITIQKVVGIIFANEDYDLTVVDNGNAALDKARELLPDIILVDALMPGKTGYEVCAAVRREPALKHVPLLLLTGAFEPFDEGKARESGADDFISKPFESQHLIDKVKTLIELGKERQAGQSIPPAAEPISAHPVPPAVAPEAVVEPLAAATAVFAAEPEQIPTATVEMEEMLFADLDVPATASVAAAAPPAAAAVEAELVEVSPDDDLWGAFDLEELPEENQVEFGTVVAEEETSAVEEVEVADEFVFAEEAEVGIVEPSTVMVEPAGDFGDKWLPVDEQTFDFREEDAFPEESIPEADPFAELAAGPEAGQDEMAEFLAEPVSSVIEQPFAPEEEYVPVLAPVAEPEPVVAPAQEMDLQFAPEEEYVPFVPPEEAETPSMAVVAASAAAAVAAVSTVEPASATPTPTLAPQAELSEEQLTALVAKISKDIIERIAWEVVPDLAENIIKEEVRRLKEGA